MDQEKKQHQKPLTIDEQINNLKELGLVINDEKRAKELLNDISYFRLIKAYSIGLKPKKDDFESVYYLPEKYVKRYQLLENKYHAFYPTKAELKDIETKANLLWER